jgi:catalase
MFITNFDKYELNKIYASDGYDEKNIWEEVLNKPPLSVLIKNVIFNDISDPNIIQIGNYIIGYDFSYDNMFGGRRFVLSYPETIQLYRQRGLFDVQIAIWDRKKLKRYRKIVNG